MEKPSHKQTKSLNPRTVLAAITGLGILSAVVYLVNFKIHDLVPGFSGLSGIQLYVVMFMFLNALSLGTGTCMA